MGEFTLTDDVRHGEGRLSPSVFLCLAQLQSSRTPLFPNLCRLRIVNANYSLDYLRLFLSPSLESLEIVGLDETCRSTLISFLSAAVVEVPNLNTLILGPGRLSRDVVDACLGFSCLKRLELVDFISGVDYRLLQDLGRLEYLGMLVIDAQGVEYAPSLSILQAEDNERTRLAADEECRRQTFNEDQECRRRLEEVEEERKQKAAPPRPNPVCSMCGKRFKKGTRRTQCSSCKQKCLNQEQCIQEQRRLEMEWSAKVDDHPQASSPECELCFPQQNGFEGQEPKNEDEVMEEVGVVRRGVIEELVDFPVGKADVTGEVNASNFQRIDDSYTPEGSARPSSDSREEPSHRMFPKLLEVTIRAGAEMMQDIVELIDSASVGLLSLDMVPVQPSPLSSVATSPSRRFVATVDSALRRWAGTIVHVTLSGLPGVASKLPDETVRALVRLPQLEHLELSGWDVGPDIANYFCRLGDTNTSKLKVLHLPNDNNAISMSLSQLESIAEACPNLLSFRCRLGNLLDIPNRHHSLSGSKLLSHSLETLTIGDANPPMDFEAILEVAQYIDNLFPKIEEIKPLEGMVQNAEQWRRINKLVKFRQSGWLDRLR